MPLPIITVPPFPNVPNVPGVPALVRAGNALNTLSGSISGTVDAVASTFEGRVNGVLSQVNGLSSPVNVLMQGVIDTAGNIAGTLDGTVAGSIVGVITGNPTGGFFSGLVSGVVDQLTGAPGIMTADAATVLKKAPPPKWGLYKGGALVLEPDSIVAFEYRTEWRLSNYPVEQGGFETYNKVALPAEPRLVMSKAGSEAVRAAFLAQVRAIAPQLDLYDIVTPQATFSNMNVKHWDYDQRADRGANVIVVEFQLEEVRTVATSTLTTTATPAGSSALNSGPVTALPPTAAQATAAAGGAS